MPESGSISYGSADGRAGPACSSEKTQSSEPAGHSSGTNVMGRGLLTQLTLLSASSLLLWALAAQGAPIKGESSPSASYLGRRGGEIILFN